EDRGRGAPGTGAGTAGTRQRRHRPGHHHDRRRLAAAELRRVAAADDRHPGDGGGERDRLRRSRNGSGTRHDPRVARRAHLRQLPAPLTMGTPPRRPRARSWRRVAAIASTWSLALLVVGSAVAQEALDLPAPRRPDLRVEDVTVGQRGHAVTAGPGNRLERFPVEVVAVLWDAGPGFPLVLVRAGGPFIEATGGIAAGMSGSPVYLDTDVGAALLGAIGYVFPNADHELALVTPIAAMRSAARADAEATPATRASDAHEPDLPFVPGLGRAEPVATPILMPGASPRVASMLQPLFRNVAVTPFPAQGGGIPTGREPAYVPEPGGAIA